MLKRGGVLVLCFRPQGAAGSEDFPSTVYRFYDDAEVLRLLRAGGFTDVSVDETGTSRGLRLATARVGDTDPPRR